MVLKFVQKQRGAISIFLVIILLPMLTIGCIMVDMSRIQLARSLVSSAGDLTLNTGLTCYDNVLKDMYGLFATSQDYTKLMGNLEDYYRNSISASGLSEQDTNNYVKQIMDYLGSIEGDDGITDLLQIEVTGVENTQNTEASLVNAALMKKQIVNFMKYRGPIDMGLGFFDSLKSFTTIGDQMKVIEDRNAYYDEQKDVIEKCQDAWIEMYNYNNLQLTETSFKDMLENLRDYETDYTFINQNIIRDHYKGNTYFQTQYHTYMQSNKLYYQGKEYKVKEVKSVGSKDALAGYAKDVISKMDTYKTVLNSDIVKKLYLDSTSDIYEIQRVIQFNRDIKSGQGYGDAVKDVYDAYNTYLSAKSAIGEQIADYEDEQSDLRDQISELREKAKKDKSAASQIDSLNEQIDEIQEKIDELNKWLTEVSNEYDSKISKDYNPIMKKFTDVTQAMKNTINGKSDVVYAKKRETLLNCDLVEGGLSTAKAEKVNKEINDFYNKLVEGKGFLTNASSLLSDVETRVAPNGSLTKKETTWGESAGASSIEGMAVSEQNLAEVDSVHEFINGKDVGELVTHLNGAIESLDKAITEIEGYTYADVKIKDIASVKQAVEALENANLTEGFLDVSIKRSKLNAFVKEIFAKAYKPNETELTTEWTDVKKNHVELEKGEHKFYAFLKSNFKDVIGGKDDFNKKKNDKQTELDGKVEKLDENSKKESDGAKSGSGESAFLFSNEKNLPSTLWPNIKATSKDAVGMNLDDKKNTSGTLITMFAKLGEQLVGLGRDFRDDLFITGYIMNMFSYDTKEKEAIWEASKSPTQLSKVKSQLSSLTKTEVNGVTSYAYDKDGKVTLPSNLQDAQQKLLTMTRVPISPQNNMAYLSEVEYITFGNGGKTATYGTIYGIRFAFNTIYAFSDSSIREGARGIAMAIFGTPPLTFLVPIAQAAIIIGVALAESALDLSCIQSGMAVPIYKNKNTWMLSFENLFNTAKDVLIDTAVEKGKELAVEAIDQTAEKLNKYLDMTSEELSNLSKEQIKELQHSVESSLSTAVEQYAGTAVDQLITLCQKAKTLKNAGQLVNKAGNEVDEVQYITEALNDWVNGDGNAKDSLIYLAKKEAVKLIINNGYIKTMLEQIENLAGDTEAALNSFRNYTKKIILEITQKFDGVNSEINKYIESAKNSISGAVKEGSDKLKESVTNAIDGLSKKSSGTSVDPNTGVVASLYSFQYSDYLQLFLLISLLANQDRVLMYTGDVIQVNMNNQRKAAGGSFELQYAYTYLELNATAEVKPLFLKIPMIEDYTKNLDDTNKNWYTIEYHNILGY